MKINNENNPEFLNEYLMHIKIAKLLSERTVQEYYFDIRMFLKYIYSYYHEDSSDDMLDADISNFNTCLLYTSPSTLYDEKARLAWC